MNNPGPNDVSRRPRSTEDTMTIIAAPIEVVTLWIVSVNGGTTEHGPMSFVDADALALALIKVPGIVDVEVTPFPAPATSKWVH